MDQPSEPAAQSRRRGIYLLPNLLTTGSLFAGFYGIIASIDGRYEPAAIAIIIAGVLDGLDGRLARLTGTESAFGTQYDSLSDMVSFGLAPAVIVYQWGLIRMAEYGWLWAKLGWTKADHVVVLNPGAAYGPAKRWPSKSFAELARRLVDGSKTKVLILCGPQERGFARFIADRLDDLFGEFQASGNGEEKR